MSQSHDISRSCELYRLNLRTLDVTGCADSPRETDGENRAGVVGKILGSRRSAVFHALRVAAAVSLPLSFEVWPENDE